LQQIVSGECARYPQVYDAGSHVLAAGACTFVVTPLDGNRPRVADGARYQPSDSRASASSVAQIGATSSAEMSALEVPPSPVDVCDAHDRPAMGEGPTPLPIGEWLSPPTTHRGSRAIRTPHPRSAATTSRIVTGLRRVKHLGTDSLNRPAATLATDTP
jgi:hypothetical protein